MKKRRCKWDGEHHETNPICRGAVRAVYARLRKSGRKLRYAHQEVYWRGAAPGEGNFRTTPAD